MSQPVGTTAAGNPSTSDPRTTVAGMHLMEIHDGALRPSQVATPSPGAGEVLIEVAAAGVNRADLLQVAGRYPPPAGAPEHPGLEVAGTVAEVGAEVEGIATGERVAALLPGGGYASHAVARADQILRLPPELSDGDAAALPEALATVWSTLVGVGSRATGGLTGGETLLVIGASGGIGTIAVQVGRLLGARVLATVGGTGKIDRVRELGAQVVIDHRARTPAEITQEVRAATESHGVDLILDVLGGGQALGENVRRLALGGRLGLIGTQAGRRGELDVFALMKRRASIFGATLRARPEAEKAQILHDVAAHLGPHLTSGELTPVIHAVVPLAQANRAHAMLRSGEVLGKVVLTP